MEKIFLSSPHMGGLEMQYIQEAFETNWIAPLGKNVDCFEQETADYVGMHYGAALSSGTAAIHMALKAAGVEKGDIVFCSSLTFAASANPIMYVGAVPVFIDSEDETWNMDPRALEMAFEKYGNVKAVVVVDLYGTPAKWDEIVEICKRNHAVIIEDSAEALGSVYQGTRCGAFGEYGILSFNGNKIITTSGGGMLLVNDSERAAKVRFWATQAREKARHYQHEEIGYNYRMSNVVAGIGRGQLQVLEERVKKKQSIFKTYQDAFADIPAISMMPYTKESEPNFWLSCILIDKQSGISPEMVIEALEKENIESRPIWKPMHMQPVFREFDYVTARNDLAKDIFECGLCLPSDTKMTDADLKRVIDIVKNCFC